MAFMMNKLLLFLPLDLNTNKKKLFLQKFISQILCFADFMKLQIGDAYRKTFGIEGFARRCYCLKPSYWQIARKG